MGKPLLYFGIACNKSVKNYFPFQGGWLATPHESTVTKKQKIELGENILPQNHLAERFNVEKLIVMLYLETIRCEYLNKGGVNQEYPKVKRKQPDHCDCLRNIPQQISVTVEEAQESVLSNWERYEGTNQDMCTYKTTQVTKPDPLHFLERLS